MPLVEREIIPVLSKEIQDFYLSLIDQDKELPIKYDLNELYTRKMKLAKLKKGLAQKA